MHKTIELAIDDEKSLAKVAKALSSEVRINIIQLLNHKEYNINEIAELLCLPPSTTASHIKVLEEANLIHSTLLPGIRGSMKLCSLVASKVNIDLMEKTDGEPINTIEMPIGNYVDYNVIPTCGLVSLTGPIDVEDEPRCFYNPERVQAKLLWLGGGYVEYRFPNNCIKEIEPYKIEVSAELCSEDHEYNLEYPSDITLWINDMEAGTFVCPSDFGGRRGRLNPSWWPDKNTQYGILKKWTISKEGIYLDNDKILDKTIEEYRLAKGEYISVRFGIAEDAMHKGGMNLFGRGFGDHEQDIIMKIYK